MTRYQKGRIPPRFKKTEKKMIMGTFFCPETNVNFLGKLSYFRVVQKPHLMEMDGLKEFMFSATCGHAKVTVRKYL